MKKTLFAILIIIILAVVAYFAYTYRSVFVPSGTESVINKLESQSSSDQVADIEADLESTNLDNLDSELSDIESELQNTGL